MQGYKTFIFGIILTLLPVLDYLVSSDIFTTLIKDPRTLEVVTSLVGITIIVLRALTASPIFAKKQEDVLKEIH